MSSADMNATPHAKAKPRKVGESMILRLSRGRSLKITFRPRIRVAKLLVKLLAIATGLFTSVIGANAFAAPPVNTLPTGGQVVHGSSAIQQAGNVLNINQASQKTIINWQSFDIGAQASVNFFQPNASAIALNRVLGDNASQIFGKLNANGQVFLLNPHGTLFAPGSQVNVGGLLNSTMQMTDENFINGNYILTNPGNGILDNQGTINAQSIVFAGNNITNSGNMIATSVSLVAGNTVAVDLSGDGLIRARVQNPAMQASISNSGLIDAVQQVTMSAGQVKDTLNSLVNNTGIVRATGLVNEGGVITLQAGKAMNSGSLDASSATGLGGKVAMLGEHVGVTGTGSIDASGKTGGGTILVGGDFQGKNAEVQNASRTFFGKDASLNADATEIGNGGKIIVWADEVTRGYGNISARGGDISGNGGFVEVSGKRNLDYQATTDTRAPNGNIGTLLLDPDSIEIIVGGTASLTDVDQFSDLGATLFIAPSTINNSFANVVLQANQDINFESPIAMTNLGTSLTARAGGFLNVNASISTLGGAVTLVAGDSGSLTSPTEGSFNLSAGNTIDTTGGGSLPAGADVSITSNLSDVGGNSVFIAGNINVGTAGLIELTTTNTRVEQTGSSILTGRDLFVISQGDIDLIGNNQIDNVILQGDATGDIVFNNTRNLTVQSVTSADGNVTINTTGTNRTITIDGPITADAGNVSLSATGDILSTGVGAIDTSGSNGNISLSSLSDIGTDTQNIRINPGTGNVNISASDNVYINQIGSALNTSKYVLSTNLVQAIISLKSDTGINIDSFSSTNQFTNDDNFVFTATGGNINISGNSTLTANLVRLNSGAGGIIGTGGISTNNLAIDSAGTVNLTGSNQVNTLAANVTGLGSSFTFNNTGSNLNIASVNGFASINTITGITTNNGVASITGGNLGGSLTVNEGIDLGNANLVLGGFNIDINNSIEASNVTIAASNDVHINGDITQTGSTSSLLAISAGNDITIEGGSDFTSPGAAMTVILTSDTDLNNIGFISLKNDTSDGGVSILSNGGNIELLGGSGVALNNSTLRTNATGTINIEGNVSNANIGNRGVVISASTVESVNGNITIIGDASASTNTSGSDSDGVLIEAGSLIITQGIGNIDIVGKSAVGGTSQSGIAIADAPTEIDTHGTGNITLDGVSNGVGATSFGIDIYDNALVEAEGGGNIKITGQAINFSSAGLSVEAGSAIKTFLGGDLDIRAGNSDTSPGGANHIELAGSTIQGSSGSLMFLRTLTTQPDVGIGVGGDGSTLGAFNISDNDLAAITGFDTLTIGDTAHTGPFTVASLASFSSTNQQLNLLSNSTLINFTTPTSINSSLFVNANAGDVTLNTLTSNSKVNVLANNDITALPGTNITAGVQGAEFKATNGNITLSSVNTSGDIKAVADGNITINNGAQIQGDKILLAAQTGNFINNAGSTALSATNHWTVVSQSPSLDTRGGLVSNYKQYNTTYNPLLSSFSQTIQGTGDGFVYSLAPSLELNPTGIVSKQYDTLAIASPSLFTLANVSATGLEVGDSLVSVTPTSLTFSDKDAGTAKLVTATGLNFVITEDGTGAAVYGYSNQTGSTLSGNIGEITKANATVTANSNTFTYNGATQSVTGFTASGLVGGETESVLTGVSTSGGSGQNAGTYAHLLSGTDTNYNLTFVNGALNIDKANTTVTAASNTVTYNGEMQSVTGFTASGLVGGETESVLTGVSTSGGSGQNAGTYAYILSGSDTNYNLTFVNGALNIDKANATVTANSNTVTYNGSTQSVTGFTASGLVGGETESVLTGISGTGGSGRNAGTYAHTLSGTDTNYNLTFVDGSLTIDQAILNLSAASDSRVYDGTVNSSGIVEKSGLQSGDTISALTQVFDSKNAGTRTLSVSSGYTINDGNGGANYIVSTNTAEGNITPRDLTVSAQGINKLFDGTTVAQVILTDNRIAGDNLTITNSSANFADAEVGINKQIDVLGITIDSGTDAGNYNLVNTDAIAFADIFKEDGTKEANLTETNVIDSTQNLALALTPIQVKILNPDGSESLINVDVPKGKVLSCK